MCFSATASFTAAAVTMVAGGAALGAAPRSHRLLAGVPLLFAIHQFAEGVLWVALSHPARAGWGDSAMLVYLVVSKVVWPVWVPLAILALETMPRQRRLLAGLLILGALLAPLMAYGLGAYPVVANTSGAHIQYRQETPLPFRWITDIAYAVAVVLPPMVASNRVVRLIGLLLIASLVLTKIFFYYYFASVWCFFAAGISVLVVLAVRTRTAAAIAPRLESGGA